MDNSLTDPVIPKDRPTDNQSNKDKEITTLVVVALIAGMFGGIIGVRFFTKTGGTVLFGNQKTVVVEEDSAVIEVAEKTKAAIVSIVGHKKVTGTSLPDDFFFFFPFDPSPPSDEAQERQVSAGTGFFVNENGLIATNKHVVADSAARYTVFTNHGKQYDAVVVATDPVNDLALIKIEGDNFSHLTLADSDSIKVGQRVIAIGNALGQFTNTVTTGVVSGINRSVVATGQSVEISQIEGAIQTDAAINPGNSGGPLLDLTGAVVGINTAISSQGQLIGFAIPSNDLRKDVETYNKQARIIKPFIGIRYIIITPSLKDERNLPVDEGALVS